MPGTAASSSSLRDRPVILPERDGVRLGPVSASGALVQVLLDWCPLTSGLHLYYPSHRQNSPAFQIVVDALRYRS